MGIELLRMIMICMIMVLHTLGQGGVLKALEPLSASYDTAWFLEILAIPAVTTFGLISGFVGYDHEHRVSDAVHIWLEVMFYTVIGSVVFFIVMPETMTRDAVVHMLFPVTTESYWYVSAYIGVFFFMNAINHAVRHMPERQVRVMLTAAVVLFSVLPQFTYTDAYALRFGCSVVTLAMLYLIGTCMRRFGLLEKCSNRALILIFIGCIVLTWVIKIGGETLLGMDNYNPDRYLRILAYFSPTIVLAGMCLVRLFSRLNVRGALQSIVRAASPMAFGVYLLNAQPLVYRYLMGDRFVHIATLGPVKLAVCVMLTAIALYLICTAADAVRHLIFGLIGVKQRLIAIENYMISRRETSDHED